MPRENSESGLSRWLVCVNASIDRSQIFLAQSSSECTKAARKFLHSATVIALARGDCGEKHPGQRTAQGVGSLREFRCRVDVPNSPPQTCFVKEQQRITRIRLERAIINRFRF